MAIAGNIIRVRTGENLARVWSSVSQRGKLFGDMNRIRANDTRPLAELVALRGSSIQIPEMVGIPGMANKRIMTGELTVRLFKSVMADYEITGHNAGKLQAIMAGTSKQGSVLTYVSLLDARNFAETLSTSTGRSFRVQTEGEWKAAKALLTGNNWTWTETPHSDSTFVLRHLSFDGRFNNNPGYRFNSLAVRLVEDLPAGRQA